MGADLAELRRLALLARDDDGEPTRRLAVTTHEANLALALDPQTVLALLDELAHLRTLVEDA